MNGASDDEGHAANDRNGDKRTGGQVPNLASYVLVHGLSPASPPWMTPLSIYYRVLSVLFVKDSYRHCAIALQDHEIIPHTNAGAAPTLAVDGLTAKPHPHCYGRSPLRFPARGAVSHHLFKH